METLAPTQKKVGIRQLGKSNYLNFESEYFVQQIALSFSWKKFFKSYGISIKCFGENIILTLFQQVIFIYENGGHVFEKY